MKKIYMGWQLIKAIAKGKIKENTSFEGLGDIWTYKRDTFKELDLLNSSEENLLTINTITDIANAKFKKLGFTYKCSKYSNKRKYNIIYKEDNKYE